MQPYDSIVTFDAPIHIKNIKLFKNKSFQEEITVHFNDNCQAFWCIIQIFKDSDSLKYARKTKVFPEFVLPRFSNEQYYNRYLKHFPDSSLFSYFLYGGIPLEYQYSEFLHLPCYFLCENFFGRMDKLSPDEICYEEAWANVQVYFLTLELPFVDVE